MLADLAAGTLGITLFLFATLASLHDSSPSATADLQETTELSQAFDVFAGPALTSSQLVQAFYDRTENVKHDRVSIDAFSDRVIVVSWRSGSKQREQILHRLSADFANQIETLILGYDAVEVFVFSTDVLETLHETITENGRNQINIHVPNALKQSSLDGSDHWHADVQNLFDQTLNFDSFVASLTRLLLRNPQSEQALSGLSQRPTASFLERLSAKLRDLLSALFLVGSGTLIWRIERYSKPTA